MVSSVKANHSPPKLYRFFSTRRFGSSLFTLDRDGFSDKSSFQDYLLNLSSSATLGQMLSVLWPIRHPEVQPGGGGNRVVVVSVQPLGTAHLVFRPFKKLMMSHMASGKPCHRLRTHFGNQNGVRHKKRGNQFIGHVISNQLRRPLVFGLPSDDVYQYLGGLLLLLNQNLSS